ncbi:MAG TPA: dTMP kinase, partial [Candidatus Saccharimonadia bacterium]|nr:dTMP kinase [Candidatus Saccharimonadia bacterium]
MSRAKYIVFEGTEGTGKTTQITLLSERLKAAGLQVRIFREPDSQTDLTARTIRRLTQNPEYPMNTRTEVLLYNAARSQSLEVIRQSIDNGIYCICDRNYLTTLAIQYYGRSDVDDYDSLNSIIRFAVNDNEPDLTIIFDLPVQELSKRLNDRKSGDRFDNLDVEFLERVRAGYLWEAKKRNIPVIFTNKSIEEVSDEVWEKVKPVLSERKARLIQSMPTSIDKILDQKSQIIYQPDTKNYVSEKDGLKVITDEGRKYLEDIITDTTGNVYAFKNKMDSVTIAASMARLSRRFDDLRITLLDEFSGSTDADEKLLRRVISEFGDDSVQQLSGHHIVVEGASNLLTKKIEWGRLAAYLEQSTRYIYYDRKDLDGKYNYYVPPELKPKIKKNYI